MQEIINETLHLCLFMVVSGYSGQGVCFIPEFKEEKTQENIDHSWPRLLCIINLTVTSSSIKLGNTYRSLWWPKSDVRNGISMYLNENEDSFTAALLLFVWLFCPERTPKPWIISIAEGKVCAKCHGSVTGTWSSKFTCSPFSYQGDLI